MYDLYPCGHSYVYSSHELFSPQKTNHHQTGVKRFTLGEGCMWYICMSYVIFIQKYIYWTELFRTVYGRINWWFGQWKVQCRQETAGRFHNFSLHIYSLISFSLFYIIALWSAFLQDPTNMKNPDPKGEIRSKLFLIRKTVQILSHQLENIFLNYQFFFPHPYNKNYKVFEKWICSGYGSRIDWLWQAGTCRVSAGCACTLTDSPRVWPTSSRR